MDGPHNVLIYPIRLPFGANEISTSQFLRGYMFGKDDGMHFFFDYIFFLRSLVNYSVHFPIQNDSHEF